MTRLDGRTKVYKLHAQRLQAQRERRQKLKDSRSNKYTKGFIDKYGKDNTIIVSADIENQINQLDRAEKIKNELSKLLIWLFFLYLNFEISIKIRFFFNLKILIASLSNFFAKITSKKIFDISLAIFLSILKLHPTTPPNALIGSHARASL